MASRHLMDHINDGFFRYTTDPDWQTPHFEKMLYDNAQLVMLYLQADRLFPGQGYRQVAERSLAFMDQALADPVQGLYWSSLSAVDENNREGGAYWWTLDELRGLLSPRELKYLIRVWELDPQGQEPFLARPLIGIGASPSRPEMGRSIRDKLRKAPKTRTPVDVKQLASWNALALRAWVTAAEQTGKPAARERAKQLYRAITDRFLGGADVRRFAGDSRTAETTLEDYAQMASALAAYGRVMKDREAAARAQTVAARAFQRFYRDGNWYQDERSLIPGDPGMAVVPDEVLQSPVPLLLEVVLQAQQPDPGLKSLSVELLRRVTRDMVDTPFYHGTAILLRQRLQER